MDLNDFAIWGMLKAEMPEGGLEEIADADYGMDREEYLVALQHIVNCGIEPSPVDFVPGEVVALTTYRSVPVSRAEDAWAGLFCGVLLLWTVSDPVYEIDYPCDQIILAIDCATFLGPAWQAALLEYLRALFERYLEPHLAPGLHDDAVVPLGCIILSVLLGRPTAERIAWHRAIGELHRGGVSPRMAKLHPLYDPWDCVMTSSHYQFWREYLLRIGDEAGDIPIRRKPHEGKPS